MAETSPIIGHSTDEIRRVLRFLAWFGIIYGALSISAFAITAWLDMRFILIVVRQRTLWRATGILTNIAIDGASILLLFACVGLLRNKAHSRAILISWALCVIALRLVAELHGLFPGFGSSVRLGPWTVQSVMSMVIQCNFPLVIACIFSHKQMVAALATPRGFEVLIGNPVQSTELEIVLPVEETAEPVSGWAADLTKRLAWIGLVVGAAAAIDDITGMVWSYYGPFQHGLPGNWRDGVIVSLDRATRISFWVLLSGSVLALARKKIGSSIILLWAIGYIVLICAMLAAYDMPYLGWQATHSGLDGRYIMSNIAHQLLDWLQLSAMAIIVEYSLLQVRRSDIS